jgi:hypothetical protein
VLQESLVQSLLSSHCVSLVQQPVMFVWEHVRSAALHRSSVQVSLSLQSETVVQQFAIAVFAQTPGVPADVSQASVVQASRSLHWALVVHETAAWRTEAVSRLGSPPELHLTELIANKRTSPDACRFFMWMPRSIGGVRRTAPKKPVVCGGSV